MNGRRGGSTGSVRGSGDRFEVGNEIGRRPVVAGVDCDEAPSASMTAVAQVVREVRTGSEVAFGVDPELLRELRGGLRVSRQEAPDRRGRP